MSDLSHTIVVKPNLFIRLFVWFWDCAGSPLNTCLLFWGTLGMVTLWPFRLIFGAIGVIAALLEPVVERVRIKNLEKAHSKPIKFMPVNPKSKGPSSGAKLLMKIADAGSFIWYKFQTPITWAFRILVGLALLALVAFGIYGLTTVPWSWTILFNIVITGFVIVAVVALIIGIMAWVDDLDRKPRQKKHTIRRIYRSVHDHTCANVIIENTNSNVGSSTIQEA